MPVSFLPSSMADAREIDKHLFGDSIFVRVLGDIMLRRYKPGERLNVDAIAKEFDVSRTPVREALIRLAATRFVRVVRNSRTEVAQWNAEDMRDRLEVTSHLVRLVITDPRLDLSAIAEQIPPLGVAEDDCADVQVFLDMASAVVTSGVNRAAGYMLLELNTSLRLFFRPEVLHVHGIQLSTSGTLRGHLNEALAAASDDLPGAAEFHLSAYTTGLAGLITPCAEDSTS